YTWGLLGSIPRLDRPKPERLHSITGAPPSLINLPRGCKFRPRCPHALEKCFEEPRLEARVEDPKHLDRCWLVVDEKRSLREKTTRGGGRAAGAGTAPRWSGRSRQGGISGPGGRSWTGRCPAAPPPPPPPPRPRRVSRS